jgi:hypothetical protein
LNRIGGGIVILVLGLPVAAAEHEGPDQAPTPAEPSKALLKEQQSASSPPDRRPRRVDPAKKRKSVVDEERLTWRSIADPGEIAARGNLAGTPTRYDLDPRGVTRHKWAGSPVRKTFDVALGNPIKGAAGPGNGPPQRSR